MLRCFVILTICIFTSEALESKPEIVVYLNPQLITQSGRNTTLSCSVSGEPKPLVKWIRDGVELTGDRYSVLDDGDLRIQNVSLSDTNTYTCHASNKLGKAFAVRKLYVEEQTQKTKFFRPHTKRVRRLEVPNPPVIYEFKCTSGISTIAWHPMGENNSSITSYKIEYNTSFTPDTWDIAHLNVPTTDLKYNIRLSPWSNYTFRVSAKNIDGFSLPSQHSEVCTSQPDVPYKNPGYVQGSGTDPTNLVISWIPMDEIDHNGPGFFYRIYYKRDIPGEDWVSEDVHDWRKSELLVRDQPTFKPYRIKVVAMNERGESNATPVEVIGFSGEGTPLEAPVNFTLVQIISNTTALFSWNPISLETVQGHLKGYKIQIWEFGDMELFFKEYTAEYNSTEKKIDTLVPFTQNYVKIFVYNGCCDGPQSDILIFNTTEGVPDFVLGFRAFRIGSSIDTLYLVWAKPYHPHGILTGYKITYQKLNGIEADPKINVLRIHDPNQNSKNISGLDPNTEYRFTISGTTSAGDGKEFIIKQRTGAIDDVVPDVPDFRATVVEPRFSDDPIEIRVTRIPTLNNKSLSNFYVKYKLKGDSVFQSSEHVLNRKFIIITIYNLGVYEVKIAVPGDNYFKESQTQEIDLVERPIIQYPRKPRDFDDYST